MPFFEVGLTLSGVGLLVGGVGVVAIMMISVTDHQPDRGAERRERRRGRNGNSLRHDARRAGCQNGPGGVAQTRIAV
jgi:hypothetical protein